MSIVDYPHHITVEWRVDGWWKTSQTQSRISPSHPCQFLEHKFSLNMHEYICLRKLTRWRFERLNQYLNLEKIQINHQSKFSEKHWMKWKWVAVTVRGEVEWEGEKMKIDCIFKEKRVENWCSRVIQIWRLIDFFISSCSSLSSPSPGFCWKSSFAQVSIALPTMMTMSMLNKFHHRRRSSL